MSGARKSFDPAQKAAIDRDENVVVSAGAGSGKTTVLVERYARLVEERGLGVDSILALTFTRKAAAEMNSRIHARLSASEHPRAREELARFDAARISTLDSFCASIARGAAQRYGIPPDFAVDEARLARAADETAVELLMERKDDPALRRLVATLGFDRVRRELLAGVAAEQVSIARAPSFAADARRQIRKLESDLRARRDELEAACGAILGIAEEGGDSLEKAKALVSSLLPLPGSDTPEDLAELASRAEILSSGDLRKPGKTNKNGIELLKEFIDAVRTAAGAVKQLCGNLRMREDIEAVGEILDDLGRRFLERKRREGTLSFQDSADLAVDILKNDREIRAYFKRCLKSILIDEFQDNNELQKELLFLLAEREDLESPGTPPAEALSPDKLFFVGDEKQSIYRFRGADVSVFRRLSGELERAAGKSAALALDYNHRSSAELVSFYNAFFPGVFGPAESDFEARFSAVDTLKKPAAADGGSAPAVEFHLYEPPEPGEDDEEDLSAAEAEACAAAARLRRGADSGEFAYAEVAVLFRSTSHQHEYEKAFRAYGIPYQASDPRGLFSEAPANDLYSVLRLCLFPQDRNAYAAVLRSPFVRLGDESLARILLDERREPFPADAKREWFSSETDAARFARGAALYASVRAQADLTGIAEIAARLWYDEGYRAALLESGRAAESADHFEKLYSLALDADRRHLTLGAFLDELAPLMGSYEKVEGDEGTESSAGGAVRIMTVHKSKGLEFPVVLVADAGNDGRGVRNDRVYYADAEYGVAVNLRREDAARKERIGNWFFERAKEGERARDLAELRRLLYVAATRAERRLLVFGCRKMNADMREKLGERSGAERCAALLRLPRRSAKGEPAEPKSFLDLVACGLSAPEAAEASCSTVPIEPSSAAIPVRADEAPRAAAGPGDAFYAAARTEPRREARRTTSPTSLEAARAAQLPPRRTLPDAAPGLGIDPFVAELGAETEFGTLCHLTLERALASGSFRAEALIEDCAALFPRAEEAARRAIAESARLLAEGFLCSELGLRAKKAARLRTEFPFLLALHEPRAIAPPRGEGKPFIVNGTMDLVFEEAGTPGRCVVVDFKTDRVVDPDSHSVQMACYREAASAFSDCAPESWLFYLRGAFAVPIFEVMDLGELTEKSR